MNSFSCIHQFCSLRGLLFRVLCVFFIVVATRPCAWATKLSQIEEEITTLRKELAELPKLQISRMPDGARPCWITCHLKEGMESLWIQFDFGKSITPDSIALVPDYTSSGMPDGFPQHLTITLSDTKEGWENAILVDYGDTEFEFHPETIPHFLNSEKKSGRYLTLILYPPKDEVAGRPVFRFSEVCVFQDNVNLALNASISSSLRSIQGDFHGLEKLNDGWTPLPIPEDPTTTSSCEGYHSYHSEGTTDPASPYWVQIDLGKATPIDQINLIPVTPKSFVGHDGYHFPRRFLIEGSLTEDFSEKIVFLDSTQNDFPHPRNHLFSLGCKGDSLRYIRLFVPKLERGLWNSFCYTIAEIQVISQGKNVAKDCPVQAYRSLDDLYFEDMRNDLLNRLQTSNTSLTEEEVQQEVEKIWQQQFDLGLLRWAKQGLVDGYSSHHQLVALPTWIRMLDRRAFLQARVDQLDLIKYDLMRQERYRAKLFIYSSVALCIVVSVVAFLWYNKRRKQTENRLRMQLAEDLHDDLGSDICNISLVSQLLEKNNLEDDVILSDRIKAIRQSANNSLDSIRNIILLTQDIEFPLKELAVRLNHITQNFLSPVGINFNFRFSSDHSKNISLARKPTKEIIFAFKEILTNICKHAQANHVEISFHSSAAELTLTIVDNGIGISGTESSASQLGISSIKKRLDSLQGSLSIQSSPNKGSKLTMHIPIKQCSSRKKLKRN